MCKANITGQAIENEALLLAIAGANVEDISCEIDQARANTTDCHQMQNLKTFHSEAKSPRAVARDWGPG